MFFNPFGLIVFFLLIFVFIFLFVFIQLGLITIAFERLGLNEIQTFSFLLLSLLGSGINIPIKKIEVDDFEPLPSSINFFGMVYQVPQLTKKYMIIAINMGGAVIPIVLSLYLMIKWQMLFEPIFSTLLVAAITYHFARPVPGVGIAIPVFIPPIIAALMALALSSSSMHAPALAYISATMGTLLGADILHIKDLKKVHAPIASIGGAGTFDGVFLAGIIAVILS